MARVFHGSEFSTWGPGGLTFHDLRHTFVTDMRKAGVPEKLIMKITGHSTREMFDRYNTITPDEKDQASVQLVSFRSNPKKENAVTANNHDSDNGSQPSKIGITK
jgi:integrase